MTSDSDLGELLTRISHRVALADHDGRSGATLERGLLDGTRAVIIKTVTPEHDLTYLIGGDPTGRERRLWSDGVLDLLPAGTGYAILAAGWVDGQLVTVMRDLGDAVLSWDRVLTPEELARIFAALAAVHRCFAGQPPEGLCDLRTRLSLFAPERLSPLAAEHELARAVLTGWDQFVDLAPRDVADAVLATLQQPDHLVALLSVATPTLCHGDAWIVNLALTPNDVVFLDWNLATRGPASVDLVDLVVGCAAHVALPADLVLAAAREACRELVDDAVWDATVFWALCELGWNKALDAAAHPDHAQRARARAELQWWIERADTALSGAAPRRPRAPEAAGIRMQPR